jgi:hypothetical protein
MTALWWNMIPILSDPQCLVCCGNEIPIIPYERVPRSCSNCMSLNVLYVNDFNTPDIYYFTWRKFRSIVGLVGMHTFERARPGRHYRHLFEPRDFPIMSASFALYDWALEFDLNLTKEQCRRVVQFPKAYKYWRKK